MTQPISSKPLVNFSLEFVDDNGWSRFLPLEEGDVFYGGLLTNKVMINQTVAIGSRFFERPLGVFEDVLKKIFRVSVVSEQTPDGPKSKVIYNFSMPDEMPQTGGPATLKMDPADVQRLADISKQLHESPVAPSQETPTLYLPQEDIPFLKGGSTAAVLDDVQTVQVDLKSLAVQERQSHAVSMAPTMAIKSSQVTAKSSLPRLELVEVLDDDPPPPRSIQPQVPRPSAPAVSAQNAFRASRSRRIWLPGLNSPVSFGLSAGAILLGFGFEKLIEWNYGRELEPHEKIMAYALGGAPVAIGSIVAGSKPWSLTTTLRAAPFGIIGAIANATAVNISGRLLGFDMDTSAGELTSGIGGAALATMSTEATVGGVSAASAGLTLTGLGIGILSGVAIAGSAVGGVAAGIMIDQKVGPLINKEGDRTLSEFVALKLLDDPWLFALGTVYFGSPLGPMVYGGHRLYDWYESRETVDDIPREETPVVAPPVEAPPQEQAPAPSNDPFKVMW
jgi:hypothetical protein